MTTVGIYVDGPNMERGLWDAGDVAILERIGTLLVDYGSELGQVVEGRVFVDEATIWRTDRTRADYERRGFALVESKSFRHIDPRTKRVVFGKSLTDPSMHCAVVDRLHDEDCPDVFVLATGDKDITIVLDYIYEHGKKASVLGEANSISSFLITKCDALGFGCHIVQLVARSLRAQKAGGDGRGGAEGHRLGGPPCEHGELSGGPQQALQSAESQQHLLLARPRL